MLPNKFKNSQTGYVAVVVMIFMLLIAAFFYPWKFPKQTPVGPSGTQYCREFTSDLNPPTFDYNGASYKLIKKNVPINPSGFEGEHHVKEEGNIIVDSKTYKVLLPGGDAGKSYDFNTEDGLIETGIFFKNYGLLYLLHLDELEKSITLPTQGGNFEIIDIYQDVSKPPIPLSENILKCVDDGIVTIVDPEVVVPEQKASTDKDELQLEWFLIKQGKLLPKSWWTPECKPALYLYPPSKQLVNVKVYPSGFLTYVDPPYDKDRGWTVWANPDGKLQSIYDLRFAIYDYLYFESKIHDHVIKKPEQGWVVKFSELEKLYQDILPKLGLNPKQTLDFIEYWNKALPESPYYFVGVIDKDNVDQIERLEITPKPDSINRVRVYFERLDSPRQVEEPSAISHQPSAGSEKAEDRKLNADSFRVVEWGGMVKTDPDHPFTCSQ